MKKLFLTPLFLLGVATVQADDYPYLTFQTSDGAEVSVESSSLVITFENGKMMATSGGNSINLTLSDLAKMYFSAEATGIESTSTEPLKGAVEAFSLSGISLGKYENIEQARQALPKGIYVVKSQNNTRKIAVQ